MSCREQREAQLRGAERDKFGAEIQDITGTSCNGIALFFLV
jgi:hypothetical protein